MPYKWGVSPNKNTDFGPPSGRDKSIYQGAKVHANLAPHGIKRALETLFLVGGAIEGLVMRSLVILLSQTTSTQARGSQHMSSCMVLLNKFIRRYAWSAG